MSMTWQDAEYEAGMEALYAEFKPQAIEEFKDDRLQSYYVAHPNVAEAPQRSLTLARQLSSQYPTPAFIFAAIAIEVSLKEAIIKPVVYGLIHSESIAELITKSVIENKGMDKFSRLLFGILSEYGGIDLAQYKRSGASRPLWEEINAEKNGILKMRNFIMHRADIVGEEESCKAIAVASIVLDELFPSLIQKLGLHLHEGGRVCNDWRCRGKELLEMLKLESGPNTKGQE